MITDKLPETDEEPGSAAELLSIPNIYARRYAKIQGYSQGLPSAPAKYPAVSCFAGFFFLRAERENCIKEMENLQVAYAKLAEIDLNRRGVSFIPFYRGQLKEISNVRLEEVSVKLPAR